MKPTNNSNIEHSPSEPASLRTLRILTVAMTIVMIFGFILIVSLLSIAIQKNIAHKQKLNPIQIAITENEFLSSITYSSDYTILLISGDDNIQSLRILSNKTGKILSNTLVSDLLSMDSEK
tara:strand:+ start:987 stop:1349 length:363 start_codon:yes stop_codon:yes gene_type:complete